ncbi:MAG: hypothetical protein O2904_03250 [bacterium]|nr:hypothetical protein [bacterium]
MALVQMQKVAIIAHKAIKEELIEALHTEGVVQIAESETIGGIDHTEVEFRAAELQFAITTLSPFASKQTKVVVSKPTNAEQIIHAALHTDIRGIIDELHKLEEQDTESQRQIQELTVYKELLSNWRALPYSLDKESETANCIRIYGTLPDVAAVAWTKALQEETPKTDIAIISSDKGATYAVAHVWKNDGATFEQISTGFGWTTVELPELKGVPAEVMESATAEIRELGKKREQSNQIRSKLSIELPSLLRTAQYMHWLDDKQGAREAMAETESTLTILGWMPKKNVELLESRLQKVSTAIAVLKVKADKGEEVPVLLKNSKFITPFESVTNLYGLPLSNEMDPTKSLSPFFILYFSLCLTDAGYGAVIALIFGGYLLKTRKTIEEARLPWLLFFGGIMTFLVSIPFGGWFGFTPEQVPAMLTKQGAEGLLFKGQIWNLSAQSGIDFLQNLSLFLGITHLFFGMFLAGQHKWIHGKKVEALWVDFTAHLLLGTIIIYALRPTPYALYSLYAAIAIMIWGKGYGSRWFIRPIAGLLGMLNFVISMISNGLSYLRILALGLVTGAIAAAINQVAVEIGNLFPVWIGIPVIILIFVVGHIVSIALNTLGSFIHSGRLQFIEFFSQFFEGGGRGFTPFKRTNS